MPCTKIQDSHFSSRRIKSINMRANIVNEKHVGHKPPTTYQASLKVARSFMIKISNKLAFGGQEKHSKGSDIVRFIQHVQVTDLDHIKSLKGGGVCYWLYNSVWGHQVQVLCNEARLVYVWQGLRKLIWFCTIILLKTCKSLTFLIWISYTTIAGVLLRNPPATLQYQKSLKAAIMNIITNKNEKHIILLPRLYQDHPHGAGQFYWLTLFF